MPGTFNTELRKRIMNDFGDIWNVSGGSKSKLVLFNSSAVELVSIDLPDDAFGVADDSGIIRLDVSDPVSGTASASGMIDNARLENNDGTLHILGLTVGTQGTDIVVPNVNVQNQQEVTITRLTFQAPTGTL